jgi:hypothetical protein
MTTPINHDCHRPAPEPFDEMDDAYITEVTLEETGRPGKIASMKFFKSEKMTRCVSVGCNKDDIPIEKHVTCKLSWDIGRVAAEFDAGDKVSF